ncbi:MAG: bifunctional riboflavin kinase/FAD synthetase [Actinomycetota bacterium]
MKSLVGLESLTPPEEGCALTIGTFDGVHLGHRALIAAAGEAAEALGAMTAALTWDRHPAATLRPDRAPLLLTSTARKTELLAEAGVESLALLPFDEELSQVTAEDFVTDVLVAGLGARSVFVGHNWRFGRDRAGDVGLLMKMGADLGFEVHGAPLIEVAGEPVSSSRIRRAVAAGDMAEARALLGRPFDVDGVVMPGRSRGRELGYPTANLELEPHLSRPPVGVYAGVATIAEVRRPAAINIGTSPTFASDGAPEVRVEAFVLDFDGDIYGTTVRLEFWERLRDEVRFDSVEALVAQMGDDVEQTRRVTSA